MGLCCCMPCLSVDSNGIQFFKLSKSNKEKFEALDDMDDVDDVVDEYHM